MFSVKRCATLLIGWAMALASQATPLTTNFSDFAGLGYGSGSSQTISQDGIRLQSLAGLYEITYFPELNLKNFNRVATEVQLDMAGAHFDFLGFSIRDLSAPAKLTSDRGGEEIFNDNFQNYSFSGPLWEDLEWVNLSFLGTSAKFTSFTLDNEPTLANNVPEPGALSLMGLALAMLGVTRKLRA